LGQQLSDADLVVDDQNFFLLRHHVLVPLNGKYKVTTAPCGDRFPMVTRPWCSSAIFLTIASPRPVPFALVVTYGSNARRTTSSRESAARAQRDSVGESAAAVAERQRDLVAAYLEADIVRGVGRFRLSIDGILEQIVD